MLTPIVCSSAMSMLVRATVLVKLLLRTISSPLYVIVTFSIFSSMVKLLVTHREFTGFQQHFSTSLKWFYQVQQENQMSKRLRQNIGKFSYNRSILSQDSTNAHLGHILESNSGGGALLLRPSHIDRVAIVIRLGAHWVCDGHRAPLQRHVTCRTRRLLLVEVDLKWRISHRLNTETKAWLNFIIKISIRFKWKVAWNFCWGENSRKLCCFKLSQWSLS